jgi:endonuclease YncB( thermonuclease family)
VGALLLRKDQRVRYLSIAIAACLASFALAACGSSASSGDPAAASSAATKKATIAYVVDGDTLRVRQPSGDLAYVRLIGRLSRVSLLCRPALGNEAMVCGS